MIVLIECIALVELGTSWQLFADEPITYDSPESAQVDPAFKVQGEYAGPGMGMQVIANGDDDFDFAFFTGGLPGAGWNGSPPQRSEGDAEIIADVVKKRGMLRRDRTSPTQGAKPPAGATILFDGSQESLTEHWEKGAKRTDDGLMIQGATSNAKFRDYSLHLEFRTPFKPKAKGQARGNSGIYHQGRYETQILDSFGLEGKSNETGGIYEVRDPDMNLCFPPLAWQTYDIDFTAARFDLSGKRTHEAMLTVRLNGVVVQRETSVAKPTRAAPLKEDDSPGPIHLQDHGNPVRFQNIWIVPRDADREAMRPLVPGFERFSNEGVMAGRVLISQLGCTACHASNAATPHKQAPILDKVAARLRPDHLLAFVMEPHKTKTGTMMPDMLHGHTSESRMEASRAIASFLSTTGERIDRSGDSGAAQRGEELFHSIGCAACHSPRNGKEQLVSTSVPLGDLTSKYTLDGLSNFLENPAVIRPSGAMPKLVKNSDEARDIACYLLGELIIAPGAEQFKATVFHGSWKELPDFDKLKPAKSGTTYGLDLSIAGRKDNFGIRFDSYFHVTTAGVYKFYLGSDDGSRLLIDGNELIIGDGIHPYNIENGKLQFEIGTHALRIEYFEGAGQEKLSLHVEGPGLSKTSIEHLVTADPSGNIKKELIESVFKPDDKLASEGRQLFERIGCANCHQLKIDEKPVVTKLAAKAFNQLKAGEGCLAINVPKGLPDYALTRIQREAIESALTSMADPIDDQTQVHFQMAANNCYACHSRDTVTGPESARDKLFATKMQEMGNEGRLPPPLTGVGDKLRPEVIDRILAEGSKDRPYMTTRMPGFGNKNLVGLRESFERLDQRDSTGRDRIPDSHSEQGKEFIAAGRKLVGSMGLSCIKCHRFGDKATPGIAAIDLLKTPERLREDWFRRYLMAPVEYRPGTRMPLSFPDGRSVLTNVFDGDANKQIDAMWLYLSEGKAAKKPIGLDVESIVLTPDSRPVLYRNFIEGLGPRGIGVGYPERVNLAWDAGNMSLSLLWKNDFIDAGKHWTGRGVGTQTPLGDFMVKLDSAPPIAQLDSFEAAWPKKTAREQGYQFLGYRLNQAGQPIFRYRFSQVDVEDFVRPELEKNGSVGIQRELKVIIRKPTDGLVLRIASGALRSENDGTYKLDDQVRITTKGCAVEIRRIDDHQELRAKLPTHGEFVITESLQW